MVTIELEDTVSSGSSDSGGSAGQVVRPRAASAPADLGSPPRSPPPIRRRLSLASRGPGLRSAGSSLPSSSACPGRAGAASSGRAAVPPPGGSDGRPPRPRGMPGLSTASRCFVQPERVIQSEVERISSCSGPGELPASAVGPNPAGARDGPPDKLAASCGTISTIMDSIDNKLFPQDLMRLDQDVGGYVLNDPRVMQLLPMSRQPLAPEAAAALGASMECPMCASHLHYTASVDPAARRISAGVACAGGCRWHTDSNVVLQQTLLPTRRLWTQHAPVDQQGYGGRQQQQQQQERPQPLSQQQHPQPPTLSVPSPMRALEAG